MRNLVVAAPAAGADLGGGAAPAAGADAGEA